jgi:hypothetical protein
MIVIPAVVFMNFVWVELVLLFASAKNFETQGANRKKGVAHLRAEKYKPRVLTLRCARSKPSLENT